VCSSVTACSVTGLRGLAAVSIVVFFAGLFVGFVSFLFVGFTGGRLVGFSPAPFVGFVAGFRAVFLGILFFATVPSP